MRAYLEYVWQLQWDVHFYVIGNKVGGKVWLHLSQVTSIYLTDQNFYWSSIFTMNNYLIKILLYRQVPKIFNLMTKLFRL